MQHSLSDTYLLASKVKSRLTKEAVKSNVNLRVLVCQANLLDNLIDYLNSSTDDSSSSSSSNNNSDTEEDKLENNNSNKNVGFDDIEGESLSSSSSPSVTLHQEREVQHDSKTKITTSEIILSDDEEQDDDGSEVTNAMELSRLDKLNNVEDNSSFEEYYEYDDSSDDDSDYESDYEYVYEDVSSDEGEYEEGAEVRLCESKSKSQHNGEANEEEDDEDVEYSTDVRLNLTRCHSQNEDSNSARLQKTSNLYLAPQKSILLQSTEDLGLSRLNSLMDEEEIEEEQIEEEEVESDSNHHDLPSLSYCSSASSSDIEDNESEDHPNHQHHPHHHHSHNHQTKDTTNDNKESKKINSNIYPAVEECDLGDINELTKMYGQTNVPQPHLVYA